ncbi:MAG: sugar phosphate isomerase/epimerase [Candidatus Marinimicrobia bacterium]|nr:sugar phosphate isomerase/epimerase [Candidatus Neomarinimicrobiota bacterium]
MKLGIVLSTQAAKFSALAYKGQVTENTAKISRLGFDGIELAIRDPKLVNQAELKYLLNEVDLTVPAIGTGQAFCEDGLSFVNPEQTIRRQAIDRIKAQMHLAEGLEAMVIIGLIRGFRDKAVSARQTDIWLVEALRECARENERVKLIIEPINRYESDLICTVQEGMELMEKVEYPNVGLLLDSFHMNIEEPSIYESIRLAKDRLYHFHIADSNRWYPGAGHLDFPQIIHTLNQVNYQGFVSAEILPQPDPDVAAERTVAYMRNLI